MKVVLDIQNGFVKIGLVKIEDTKRLIWKRCNKWILDTQSVRWLVGKTNKLKTKY